MSDLRDLYQETILDHTRRPRNFGALDEANCRADGYNPLCGDRVTVYVRLEDDRVADVRFAGSGCAISTASASLMTESLKGKTRKQAEELSERFHDMLTGTADAPLDPSRLGKLAVMAGVRDYPVRVKCATLVWHTLNAALEGKQDTVTTE